MSRTQFFRRWALAGAGLATVTFALTAVVVPAQAAPTSTVPDLHSLHPVDPTAYRSPDYNDNGRSFFVSPTGRWCALGPGYAYAGCDGRAGTAPPDVTGVAISGDQSGPWYTRSGTSYTVRPNSWLPPRLAVGHSLTVSGTTCAATDPVTVTCVTGTRAFTVNPAWHKFYYPDGDTAHDLNPAPQYLPADLR